jgi:hypothetical protein
MKTFLNLILFTIIAGLMSSCTVVTDENGRVIGTEYDPKARADADRQHQLDIRDANRQTELDRRAYIESITTPSGNSGDYMTPTQKAIYDREVEFQKAQLRAIEEGQQQRQTMPYNRAASALEQARQATYGP